MRSFKYFLQHRTHLLVLGSGPVNFGGQIIGNTSTTCGLNLLAYCGERLRADVHAA